jgi:hypothetical protein
MRKHWRRRAEESASGSTRVDDIGYRRMGMILSGRVEIVVDVEPQEFKVEGQT